jgi:ABC-2 type transport system ATP-binding protein
MVSTMQEPVSSPSPLRVAGLAKQYAGGRGVVDISLTVAPGSVTGFIGANGAGKSTTLKCIMGLTSPDAGSIEIFGQAAGFASRRQLGFLPEERGLAPRERARDIVAFHARLKGMKRDAAYRRADQLLERIGLDARRGARIGELSKGNAQRVQILCAIAHGPRLLILDEPFSGLDPVAQVELQTLFDEYRAGGGAILFSTHGMAVAERLCDHVVIISGGRTVFEGPVAEAAAKAPHGVYVTCSDDAGLLEVVDHLGGSAQPFPGKMGEAVRWRVLLPKQVPYPTLMRAMAERQLPVQGFEPIQADLEGAFWSLASHKAAA